MSTHLDRKELKKPDTFLVKAQSIIDWVNQNSKTFLILIGFIFCLGLATSLYNNYSSSKELAASSEYYEIKKKILSKVKKLEDAEVAQEKAAKKEIKRTTPRVYDLFSVAKDEVAQLDSFIQKHKGSSAAFYAETFLADNLMSTKQVEKAIEYYQKAAAMAGSQALKASVLHSVGYAYEVSGNHEKAIENLQKVLNSGEKQFKADTLFALARNYESKGNKAEATTQYDLLMKDYPNTETAKAAQARKELLH